MKIATWNVNGIRARQAQLQEWLEREQPDVVCLQEIKASSDQLPVWLCEIEGYWCYWHGAKGYSGVGLHVSKRVRAGAPGVRASGVRLREPHRPRSASTRLTVVSVYVPNGGKDFPAKMRFLEALEQFAADAQCGRAADRHLRRPEHRAHRAWTCIRRSGSRARSASCRRSARCSSGSSRTASSTSAARSNPDNDEMFTWWAPWRNMRQRNIGWRLDYVLASESLFERVRGCVVQREFGTSDHAPVIAEFDL